MAVSLFLGTIIFQSRLNDFNVCLFAQIFISVGVVAAVVAVAVAVMFCLKVSPHELHIRLRTDTIPTRASSLRVCLTNLRRWTLVAVAVADVASVPLELVPPLVAVRDCGLLPLIIASRGTHINLSV